MSDTNDSISEIEAIAWALLDGQATDDQIRRLESLLRTDDDARRVYLTCMRMHSELRQKSGGLPLDIPVET